METNTHNQNLGLLTLIHFSPVVTQLRVVW